MALDFAYSIHSHIGDTALYALINKRKASLLKPLKNGDVVRIITGKESSVRCSWIDTVKTSKAKEGIKNACKQKIKECNRLSAVNIFSMIFDTSSKEIESLLSSCEYKENVFKLTTNKQIYRDILGRFIDKIGVDENFIYPKEFVLEHFRLISNKHIKDIEFDYCCHPKMGDDIVAFYHDEKVIIHHKLCKEAYKKMQNHEPMVFVHGLLKILSLSLIISLQNKKGVW